MAATDAPATLSELRTALLNALKEVTGSGAVNTVVDRYLNWANHDIHEEPQTWAERRDVLRTNPPYTTGTVAVAITSLTTRRTVTGTGTFWNTANSFGDINGIGAGAKMTFGGEPNVYRISSVDSDTQITLESATPYTGTAAVSAGSYAIFRDEYTLAAGYGSPLDIQFFDEDRRIRLMGAQEFYIQFSRNSRRNAPTVATLIELGPSGSASLRPRVVLGPAPDKTYLIPYRYHTTNLAVSSAGAGAANLSADGDQPIVPLSFRMALVWKGLELWFATRQKNAEMAADFGGRYTTVILRARQATTSATDRPRFQPAVASYWRAAKRPWRGVTRRFDGNEAFDTMKF